MVLSEFALVASDSLVGGGAPKLLRESDTVERRWVTPAEACKILEISSHQLQPLIVKAGMRTKQIWRGNAPRKLVLREDVESYAAAYNYHEKRRLRRLQSDYEVCSNISWRLGVNRATLTALTAAGLIRTKPSRSIMMYSIQDAVALIGRIECLCQNHSSSPRGVTFRVAATRCRHMEVADLVAEVLSLRIRVSLAMPDAEVLQRFLLDEHDVASSARTYGAHISLDHCACLLGVKLWAVGELIQHKLLDVISVISQSGKQRIEVVLTSAENFCIQFVLTNTLARLTGRWTRTIENVLRASGVSCHARLGPFLAVYSLEEALLALGTENRPIYPSPWDGIGIRRKRVPEFSDGNGDSSEFQATENSGFQRR